MAQVTLLVIVQFPLPPALPYVLYDEYVLKPAQGPVHRQGALGSTWADFKNNKRMVVRLFGMSPNGVPIHNLPGESLTRYFYIASEEGKNAARSLLWNLKLMEDDGYCLVDLLEDNVRVFGNGQVLFKNVQFDTRENLGDQVYFARLQVNYQSAGVLIRRFHQNGQQYSRAQPWQLRVQLQRLNVLVPNQNPPPIPPNGLAITEGDKVFTFLRNRHAHRVEALKAARPQWSNVVNHDFTSLDTEMLVLVKFQRVLSVIQLNLARMGYLNVDVLYHHQNLFNLGPL